MTIRIEISKNLTEDQTNQIDHLWNQLYPIKLKNRFKLLLKDIKEYNHHILFNESDEVIGWAVAFLRDEEIWFSILVHASNQNKGYGKMLIDSLKQNSEKLCGWVIDHNNDLRQDGSTYYTPMQFYQKNGFIVTEERIETDIISAVKIRFQA
ncbi:GNAT family N-acetyltransferase [Pedobacter foliorum]|uniref:GNAT family N-acetyltransferase n=1 Tax=Pedobacter foliorum TaxID=2739058 RepID=UPI00156767C2|nr:GNAT family N-acetyltransferase [Pedobacter foliorum]NRF40688.1 GNAT family N-acetyltransferase [Pedobacter foliorum]